VERKRLRGKIQRQSLKAHISVKAGKIHLKFGMGGASLWGNIHSKNDFVSIQVLPNMHENDVFLVPV